MSIVHTAAVARRVARRREHDYQQWLAQVVATLHGVPEYDGMTVVTSPEPRGSVKTMLIRFQSAAALADWEASPDRQRLVEQANRFSTAQYHTVPGRETFFGALGTEAAPPAVRWKLCLLTIPTVYILVNILLIVFANLIPGMLRWPAAFRLGLVIPVATLLLTYFCLPALNTLFAPWLYSRSASTTSQSFPISPNYNASTAESPRTLSTSFRLRPFRK